MIQIKRLLFAFVLVLGLGTALRAPAQYAAEVGKKVTIKIGHPAKDTPKPDEIVPVLRDAGTRLEVQVNARRSPDALQYELSLWGDGLANDIPERIRSAFPSLKDAEITVASIEGQVKTSLGGVLEKKLLQAGDDPVKLEAARREVQAELQKQNPGAEVSVETSPDGRRKVEVKVKKTQP